MARTAITITYANPYTEDFNPTATTGDPDPDNMSLSADKPVTLVCVNSNAASVDFTIELPACHATFEQTQSISHTIPGESGGYDGVRVVYLDPQDAVSQDGNVYNIDSTDANFASVRFYAIVCTKTVL